MPGKVKLAFIENYASRKSAYNKRRKCILKKVKELSTLCGIEACAVIYKPHESESGPDVWPSMTGAQQVLNNFKSLPDMERNEKSMGSLDQINIMLRKAKNKLEKLSEDNKRKQMTETMYQCLSTGMVPNLPQEDLDFLVGYIDETLKEKSREIESLEKGNDSFVGE